MRLIIFLTATLVSMTGIQLSPNSQAAFSHRESGFDVQDKQISEFKDSEIECPIFFAYIPEDWCKNDPHHQSAQVLLNSYDIDLRLPDGTLHPEEYLTRGEFILHMHESQEVMSQMLSEQFDTSNSQVSKDSTDPFEVLQGTPYYLPATSLLEDYGVDVRLSDGTVQVDQPLRRGEFIIYLYKSLNNITQCLSNELSSNPKATVKDVTYMGDPFGDLWPDSSYYEPARGLVQAG
jgi:hypothetical protein